MRFNQHDSTGIYALSNMTLGLVSMLGAIKHTLEHNSNLSNNQIDVILQYS